MNEIAKFPKYRVRKSLQTDIYNNGSTETSNTHLHGAVTPWQTISRPNNRSASPESHYKHYYITLGHDLYLPVLGHSIYYGQAVGTPLVRPRLPFDPDNLLIPNIFVGILLYSIQQCF